MLTYGEPFGYMPLREAIVGYLSSARGVSCTADQVMIVAGSQQGIDLTARVILDPDAEAWLEDPGYFGARGAFIAAGASIVPVPVDEAGLDVAAGRALAPNARLAFVTPSRQLPLGYTMTLARRLALLDWARAARSWILEDDYDSEFRYASRPLSALQGIDAHGRVIYAGTFSKVMFPSMRLGYLVVPTALIESFTAARMVTDYHSPYLEQAVMTDFITEGHFERHIRRMRAIYRDRQSLLVELLRKELRGILDPVHADAGMSLVAWLPAGSSDIAARDAAARAGVDVLALSQFALARRLRPGLLLGFSGIDAKEIRDGVRRLAPALHALYAHRSGKIAGRKKL